MLSLTNKNERLFALICLYHDNKTTTKEVQTLNDRELFELYKEQVYHFCYYYMKNQADAEDITQEVFVKVILADKSKVTNMKAWILRIASNECNSVLRRRKNGILKEIRNFVLSKSDNRNPVEQQLTTEETKQEMAEVYKQLPDKIRTVIVLRYINELSIAEIAKTINIPEGTVKSRIHKGLKLLNKLVESRPKEMIYS
jgi:RNA polymerase sigma-70 factor (ECF subfamily)